MHLIVRKKTEADLLRLPHVTLREKEQQLLLVKLEMLSSKIKATNSKEEIRREVFVSNLFKITEERTVLMVWTCDVCFECYQ